MSSRPSEARAVAEHLRAGARRMVVGLAALAGAVVLLAGPATLPAAADPPLTVAEAQAQVTQLETDAAAIDEDATGVKVKLTAADAQLVMKQEDVRQQSAKVARIRKQVGQVALAQFQNRNVDTTAQLFLTSDTEGFLNKMSTVEKVSENQNTILQDYQGAQARLADLERSAKVEAAGLKAQASQLAALRAASTAKVTAARAVLARLTKEERQRIAREEAAVQAAAQQAVDQAAAQQAAAQQAAAQQAVDQSSANPSTSSSTPVDPSSIPASGKGAIALAYAEKQLGKPYVWGATGPGSFDCSGLTQSAWRAAGVSIPRIAQAQSTGAGAAVAAADLRPGDLVFFYNPVSHVGMYVGNGIIIHAPHPGKAVTYTKLSSMPFAGARRPG